MAAKALAVVAWVVAATALLGAGAARAQPRSGSDGLGLVPGIRYGWVQGTIDGGAPTASKTSCCEAGLLMGSEAA